MAKKDKLKTKKNKKLISSTKAHYNEDVVKLIKIGAIVLICFAIIYLITAIIKGEIFKKEKKQEVEIQNQEILMGESFLKNDSEYMILYYDFDDPNYSNLYAMFVSNYGSNSTLPLYTVNLATKFSQKYTAGENETANTNPTSLANLKVKGTTLIRFKDHKVTNYIEGKDAIKNYLGNLK